MGRQDIAIGALELWLLLPALGVPFGVWQYRKGCPDFIVNLLVWIILIPLVVVFSSLGLSAFTALVAVACICGCLELAGPPTYQYLHEESGPMGDGRWACPAVAEKLALIEAAAPRR